MDNLPLSIQSFGKLRTNNYIYVDKTKDILNLISSETSYFLSRPRRFGKSLLLSTIENVFLGNKELFKDTYIYDKWDWDEVFPVVRIDFGVRSHRSAEKLKRSLNTFLKEIAKENNFELCYEDYDDKFGELIKKLHDRHGKKVVVLVDEYDKPILDNISKSDVLDDMKEILHDFYQVLKSQDDYLRFVFLTGVSKFVGTSIFSGLNSPKDITLSKNFSTICGYTQDELESYFHDYIPILGVEYGMDGETVLENVRRFYNGYSWDGLNFVYNPQSTLSLFDERSFNNYWFKTGTPTFLLALLKKSRDLGMILSEVEAGSEISDSYDPGDIPVVPLMFQSGYLAIKKVDSVDLFPTYVLGIPNEEVRYSIVKNLLNVYTDYPLSQVDSLKNRMKRSLLSRDGECLSLNLREMFVNVPFNLYVDKESYYHTVFIIWLYLLGFKIDGEVITDKGRIDAVILMDKEAYIVEIKFGKENIDKLVEDALNQINTKRYYEKYFAYNINFLGVAYVDKDVKCKFKELNVSSK
jgi:hypothetical protein